MKEKRSRYATCQDLADDLQRWLRGEPITARATGWLERSVRWCSRNPRSAALVGAVFASLFVGTIVSSYFAVLSNERAKVATANEKQATANATEARQQERRANAKATELAGALKQLRESHETNRRYLYVAQMAMIADRWGERDVAGVCRLLESLRPGPGEEDIRGFAWQYYWRVTHGYSHSFGSVEQPVNDAVFIDDGKTVVTSGRAVTFWDTATTEKKKSLDVDSTGEYYVYSTKDQLLVYTLDPAVRVWRLDGDDQLQPVYEDSGNLVEITCRFSEPGHLMAMSGRSLDAKHLLRVIDLSTGRPLFSRDGFDLAIRPLDFSPDETTLAIGTAESLQGGEVQLWDARTGEEIADLGRYASATQCGKFSPDGKLLVTSAYVGCVTFWDVAKKAPAEEFSANSLSGAFSMAFSPDGRVLALAKGGSAFSIQLWDTTTKTDMTLLWGHTDRPKTYRFFPRLQFSPDGKTLLSVGDDGTAKLWPVSEAATVGEGTTALQGRDPGINDIAVSSDGELLATASNDGTARLWRFSTGEEVDAFRGHRHRVTAVAFFPNHTTLCSGSQDKSVMLWDTVTGRLQRTHHFPAPVTALAASPDGKSVAVATRAGGLLLWNSELDRHSSLTNSKDPQTIMSVAYTPDGQTIAAGCCDGTVRFWETETGRAGSVLKAYSLETDTSAHIKEVAFSTDGRLLASTGNDRAVRVWNTRSKALTAELIRPSTQLLSVAFHPQGTSLVATGGDSGMMSQLWQWKLAPDGEPSDPRNVRGGQREAICAAFHPEGQQLVTGSAAGSLAFWDLDEKGNFHYRRRSKGLARGINTVKFSPDSGTLAAGIRDGSVATIAVATGKEIRNWSSQQGSVQCVAYSPNGRDLATGGRDSTVKLWDADTGREKKTLGVPNSGMAGVQSLVYSSDGRTLAAGCENASVRVWDVESAELLHTLRQRGIRVFAMDFSPDGRCLACGTGDWWVQSGGSVCVWNLETGELAWHVNAGLGQVSLLRFVDHGRTLLSHGQGRKVELWDGLTGSRVSVWPEMRYGCRRSIIFPDEQVLAALSFHNHIEFWDIEAKRRKAILKWPSLQSSIGCIDVAPTGSIIATGDSSGNVRFWRTDTREPLQTSSEDQQGIAAGTGQMIETARFCAHFSSRMSRYKFAPLADRTRAFEESVEAWKDVITAEPDVVRHRIDLVDFYLNHATLPRPYGPSEARTVQCRRAIEMLSELIKEHPESTDIRSRLSGAYQQVAMLEVIDNKDPATALVDLQKSSSLLESLVTDFPTWANRRSLATHYIRLAYRLADAKKCIEAADTVQKGVALVQELSYEPDFFSVATDASIVRMWYRTGLGLLYGLVQYCDAEDAVAVYRHLLRVWTELSEQFPEEETFRYRRAATCLYLARRLGESTSEKEVSDLLKMSADQFDALANQSARSAFYQECLAKVREEQKKLPDPEETSSSESNSQTTLLPQRPST